MTVRKTAKWFLLLLALIALAGGGYGWAWWARTDALLRDELLAKRAEIAPEWDVDIGRAHFDWNRRIHVYDVTIKARGQASPVLTLPEVVLTVDRRRLSEAQEIVIQKVQVLNPVADLTRTQDGVWNWHALLTLRPTDRPLPEWEIDQGTVNVQLDRSDGGPPAGITLKNVDARLIPSAKRQFVVQGATLVDRVGKLSLDGEWNVDAKTWRVDGRMQEVTSGSEMLGLAAISSPDFQSKLSRADEILRHASGEDALPTDGDSRLAYRDVPGARPALLPGPASGRPEAPSGVPDFGIQGAFDLDFRLEQPPGAERQFKFLVTARQGQVTNPVLPFPLRDVQGKIYWDNDQVRLRNITASNGATRVWVDGEFRRSGQSVPGRVDVTVSNLAFDDRLRGRLPDSTRRLYDTVSPTGRADVSISVEHDGRGQWTSKGFRLIAKDCSLTYRDFPYAATGLAGSIEQQEDSGYALSLEGRLGARPVTVRGRIRNPGPAFEAGLSVTVDQLPLDERFLEACPRPARKTIESIGLQGTVSGTIGLHRAAGQHQLLETYVKARIRDGALEYAGFPYRVEDLSAALDFDSVTGVWSFSDVQGTRGTAKFSAEGTYGPASDPPLKLRIGAEGMSLDEHLELALPEALREVWVSLSPTGKADLALDVAWGKGRPPRVEILPSRIYDASLNLKAFPYRLDNVSMEFWYKNDVAKVESFSAWHDQTRLRAPRTPGENGAGFVVCPPGGEWRVRVNDFAADDLNIDHQFREALRPDLRSVVESLDPRGPVSLAGTLEFRGTVGQRDPVTAAWDLEAVFAETKLAVAGGVELENVHGNVRSRGTWDGRMADAAGALDLRSVRVKGYQFSDVRGPWQLKGRQLTIGSANALMEPSRQHALEERVTARAFGDECLLTLDAAALLEDEFSYHLLATMKNGRLEEYAQQYMPGAKNLSGVMNGWVDLLGKGGSTQQLTGSGKLMISPAALYELPVILQLLKVLSLSDLTGASREAFKHAFVDFVIAEGAFRFGLIDLDGDAIRFRGKGTADFAGNVNLEFYSQKPRSPIALPILDPLLNEVTAGWVGVRVTGKASDPKAEAFPLPVLNEAMRRFLGAFEAPADGMQRFYLPPLSPPRRPAGMQGRE